VDPSLLLGGRLMPLVSLRDCRLFLDFPNKRSFFKSQLKAFHGFHGSRKEFGVLQMTLNRKNVFRESFDKLHPDSEFMKTKDIRGKPDITFKNEEGIDAGGLTREWYEIICRDMFSPDYALFEAKQGEGGAQAFQPSVMSAMHGQAEADKWYHFIGRIVGKAVCDGYLIDARFTRSFYKHMLGMPVSLNDVESLDPEFHRSMKLMLEMSAEDLEAIDANFVETVEYAPGERQDKELFPGGAEVTVTIDNRNDYVELMVAQRLSRSIQLQADAFLRGFCELVPPSLISIFTPEELELLIAGLPDIDVSDLKAHTEYVGYRPTDETIQWFWQAVENFDASDRAKFLMFVTGTSKVPLGGFKALLGQRGPQRFTIQKGGDAESLPASHTCFNTLDLPQYRDADTCREKLMIAIRECGEGFGFA
jgi:E3 ubiquitin-protein ligase HUWE1